MVLILSKVDVLDSLLEGYSAAGISGATIIDSVGLAMMLSKLESNFLSSSIKSMFGSNSEEDNKTILSIIEDDKLDLARRVIYSTVGDLSKPNTGILFTVPLDFAEGLAKMSSTKEPEAKTLKNEKSRKKDN